MKTQLNIQTEADILAFFRAEVKALGERFPYLRKIALSVNHEGNFYIHAYQGDDYSSSIVGFGKTVDEADADLASKIPTPRELVAQKRALAAKLLAEADSLTA